MHTHTVPTKSNPNHTPHTLHHSSWESSYSSEQSQLPFILSILYHIAIIIFGIITLIVSIMAYTQLNAYGNAVEDFKHNWKMRPLVDITASVGECPHGYESLIERTWPGTVDGCDCSRARIWSGVYYPDLARGACNRNQTRDGCYDIRSMVSIPLEKFYSSKICGLREGDNFVDSLRPKEELGGKLKCQLGYKPCGNGTVDEVLCVREAERCPINHVVILAGGKTSKPGYEVVSIDPQAGISLAFTSEYTGLPVIRFRLTEGEVCANPVNYMPSEGRKLYELIDTSHYSKCTIQVSEGVYDTRYDKIGSINEDRLFKDNGVFYILQNLPKYPISSSSLYTWNLYSNEYNYWNAKCELESNIDRSSMLSLLSDSTSVSSLQLTLMLVNIFYTVICILILEIVSLICECSKQNNKGFQIVSFSVKTIFLALKVYLFWRCVSAANEFEESIFEMKQAGCSSGYANRLFKNYGQSLVDSRSSNYTGLIFSTASLLLTFIFFLVELGKRSMY